MENNKINLGLNYKNAGFTLVELIVVMAIMGLVGLAVAGFIGTSANQYKSASKEVDLQYESQILMNQLGDMVQSATKVTTYKGTTTTGEVLKIDIQKDTTDKDGNTTTVIYHIYMDYDKNKLYLQKGDGNKELMAEYISDFSSSIDKDKNSVNFDVDFKNDDKTYNSTQNFTMRNKM
ncbi:PulJ/GspJ family protein [Agathobacter sp.]